MKHRPKRQKNDPPRPPQNSPRSSSEHRGGAKATFQSGSLVEQYIYWLSQPVSGASLAAFRIAVGLVMSLEALSLGRPNVSAISTGTSPLATYYTGADITFHFPYGAFEWLPLLPPSWIYVVVGVLMLAGVTMALGFCYRLSATLVFLSWGYLFAVESTRTYWQSHYYLETLLTFLMIWMPAARRYSVDAWLKRSGPLPGLIPFWPLVLLRGQLLIAYFYAGVSKLNADWLIDAVPVRWYLAREGVLAPYAGFLPASWMASLTDFIHSSGFAYFISYTGVGFDLAVGFLLLIRRTRFFALTLMAVFHAANHFLIFDDIDWFPLVGFLTALIFLDPDWPDRLWAWLRNPRLQKPDWKWLAGGAIVFPVAGALLGWKAHRRPVPNVPREPIKKSVALLASLWLVFQSLLPLRHYFISGDGRFTYEGLSFSWRLKADVHHAFGVQMLIDDPAVLVPDRTGRQRINWKAWPGEKVFYHRLTPGAIDWTTLPEILVLLEPIVGERVLFNPWPSGSYTEEQARQRLSRIWLELYGREPAAITPTLRLSRLLPELQGRSNKEGKVYDPAALTHLAANFQVLESTRTPNFEAHKSLAEMRTILTALAQDSGEAASRLRRMNPFAMEGEGPPRAVFLFIEDPLLSPPQTRHVRVDAWRSGLATREPQGGRVLHDGAEPMNIYTGDIGVEAKEMLPQSYLLNAPPQRVFIAWNVLKDLSFSKGLHISNQAFYLRRYARRVARLWQLESKRRPVIHALTAVSLNGRPHQALVDPEADLAAVPVSWWRHNPWIKDLETKRIPREAVPSARGLIGPD